MRFPLNLEKDWSAIEQEYFAQDPGIVVVDDFLTQEALENIRNLCLESTTFWDVRSTYVGSYANDGLGNHVLFRVIEELRRAMPNLIGDMDLQTMWSYKVRARALGGSLAALSTYHRWRCLHHALCMNTVLRQPRCVVAMLRGVYGVTTG